MAADYYDTLGIRRDASQADIQKAYREKARQFHPDLNPDDKNATKKFQEIQRAFDVLNDPAKREMYDRYGSAFEEAAQRGGAGGGSPFGGAWGGQAGGGGGGGVDFDFSRMFGGGGGGGEDPFSSLGDVFAQFRRAQSRGGDRRQQSTWAPPADQRHELEIPFEMAVLGGKVTFSVHRSTGETSDLSVTIPAGIEEGRELRLRGQGEAAGPSGPPGDLLIKVRIGSHAWFTRRGDNLYVKVPVTPIEAIAGATVDVPSPHGAVALRIPPGSAGGGRLRIKGHGVRAKNRDPGDLYAELQIVLPKDLSAEEVAQFRRLAEVHPQDPRRELRW